MDDIEAAFTSLEFWEQVMLPVLGTERIERVPRLMLCADPRQPAQLARPTHWFPSELVVCVLWDATPESSVFRRSQLLRAFTFLMFERTKGARLGSKAWFARLVEMCDELGRAGVRRPTICVCKSDRNGVGVAIKI